MSSEVLDLVGAGIGPFNLSLAAQLDSIPDIKARFFDKRPAFAWHPGMLLPGAEMQTSFLKDLVTGTNPTSPWSFLSYLVKHKRFYQFLNAEYEAVPRREFANYLEWVATGLKSLRFDTRVEDVRFDDHHFRVRTNGEEVKTRNLSVAVGKQPSMPDWVVNLPQNVFFHNSVAAEKLGSVKARRIAVIGGGQSGAEIIDALLDTNPDASIYWISRRPNFEPLDATPFTNELFTPGYMDCFHGLPEPLRLSHTHRQMLASDGISASTLKKLYRRLYERKLDHSAGGEGDISLCPHRDVVAADYADSEIHLTMNNGFDQTTERVTVDALVLATGYRFVLPEFLNSLHAPLAMNSLGDPVLERDFSLVWDGPSDNRIYVMNAGRHSHGIAEPQLSLAAWRSAVIANSILGRPHFDLTPPDAIVRWQAETGDEVPSHDVDVVQAAE